MLLPFWIGQANAAEAVSIEVRVVELSGTVEVSRAGSAAWDPAYTNQVLRAGDRGRTGERGQVVLQLRDRSHIRYGDRSNFEVQTPAGRESVLMELLRGVGYFFGRDRPDSARFKSRTASAAVRGTEFVIAVDDNDRMVITLLDGEVELRNDAGVTNLISGEQGIAVPGQPPTKSPVLDAAGAVQWLLYYPGVLDPKEAGLSDAERSALGVSLEAYRSGDLKQALAAYPAGRVPSSGGERLYHAALLLSVGNVSEAEKELQPVAADAPLAGALREVIAVVRGGAVDANRMPATATEWLARSITQQRAFAIDAALASAQRAIAVAPEFGFAWVRLAELEFSRGGIPAANRALDRALALSPRNAQAHALRGFMLAARNEFKQAITAFDQAIALDGALGNAWLGRGLCRLRSGDRARGILDLQTAAVMEPNRSLLRSYLGKAWADAHEPRLAQKELDRARGLDANDPTAWLYAALLHNEVSRINEGIGDLEHSLDLNENRRVYRSRLLLDQDQAVRSASLATIYQRAGMDDVSVREAARAVTFDYANHSAHQFLAESFNALRDPTRFNLRYETAWFNELLLANLLAPVGAGNLSQSITAQEYSRLFARDGFHITSDSLWRSDGQFYETASQFGTFGNFSYSLDVDYQHNDGIRPNNELDRLEWYTKAKFQITPQDSVFMLAKYQDYHSGDNFQYFFPTNVRTDFKFDEWERPILVGGYHHEWAPGIHTLALGGWLSYEQQISDKGAPQLILFKGLSGQVTAAGALGFDVDYKSEYEAGTFELSQIFQTERQSLVVGARYQSGDIRTRDQFAAQSFTNLFNVPAASGDHRDELERITGYGYYTLEPVRDLRLTAGLAYDVVTYPVGFRNPPVVAGSDTSEQLGPKAALVWTPLKEITVRGAYSRSLGGVTLDESYRLEPTQLAGFVQSYRTLISESLVGSVSAPEFETAGLGLDLKLPTRTYIGLVGQWLQQDVSRTVGVFDFVNSTAPILASSTRQTLDYDEKSAGIQVNQLLGNEWSVGAGYRFTRSDLHSVYPSIPVYLATPVEEDKKDRADLHEVLLALNFNHPSGFFARAENRWLIQENSTTHYTDGTAQSTQRINVKLPDESFPLVNLFIGFRFPRQRGDLTLGVLNLIGDDYHLNPLNVFTELPRERVWTVRLRVAF